MLFDDTYLTLKQQAEGIFRDRGSKFIALAFPVSSEEEAKEKLAAVKAEHSKARHHCWALRLTPDTSVFRLNDDGEPSGTAGRPILNSILSAGLTNIIVVVVRYFGGTLLGVPGLINAYKTATAEAIRSAEIIKKTVNDVYLLEFDYLQMNDIMRLIKEDGLDTFDQLYDNTCRLKVSVRKGELNRITAKFDKIEGLKYTYLYTS